MKTSSNKEAFWNDYTWDHYAWDDALRHMSKDTVFCKSYLMLFLLSKQKFCTAAKFKRNFHCRIFFFLRELKRNQKVQKRVANKEWTEKSTREWRGFKFRASREEGRKDKASSQKDWSGHELCIRFRRWRSSWACQSGPDNKREIWNTYISTLANADFFSEYQSTVELRYSPNTKRRCRDVG